MPKVRFRSQFKYSPDGLTNAVGQAGEVADLSEALAASAVKSGAAVLVGDDQPEDQAPEAPEAGLDAAGGDSEDQAASEGPETAEAPQGDGKTSPVEDKSMSPAEDKATS